MTSFENIKELYLSRFPTGEVRVDEPMSRHTSFRIGGPVKLMLLPKCAEELKYALNITSGGEVRRLIMGNGTDLLVSDDPLEMAVIKTCDGLSAISLKDDGVIEAECGALLSKIAAFSLGNSLAGFEFAQGIPGSLGGGLSMNAGAYGGELKDVLLSVAAADEAGNEITLSLDDCQMSYRRSVFTEGKLTALSARLKLNPGDPEEIKGKIEELAEKRKSSQPLNLPSAGSTFKRPVGGFAAALIDQAGLKGYTVGGAQVSEKHAGFVVNVGGATCRDVLALMEHIRETVLRQSGIALEPEVKIIK